VAGRFLDSLSPDDQRAVLARMTRRRTAKGHAVFHEGELGDTLHLVVKGHVAIRPSTVRGESATLTVHGAGDVFGEQALLAPDSRRLASAYALDDVETKVMHAKDFHDLRAARPAVERFLIDTLDQRVRRLTAQVMAVLFEPAEGRVVAELAGLAALYDTGTPPIEIGIRQEDLASMAGTTRPTANKVLRELSDAGVVALGRGRLAVLDRARLDGAANGAA
jgi:CRP-like cAMP-binding protein